MGIHTARIGLRTLVEESMEDGASGGTGRSGLGTSSTAGPLTSSRFHYYADSPAPAGGGVAAPSIPTSSSGATSEVDGDVITTARTADSAFIEPTVEEEEEGEPKLAGSSFSAADEGAAGARNEEEDGWASQLSPAELLKEIHRRQRAKHHYQQQQQSVRDSAAKKAPQDPQHVTSTNPRSMPPAASAGAAPVTHEDSDAPIFASASTASAVRNQIAPSMNQVEPSGSSSSSSNVHDLVAAARAARIARLQLLGTSDGDSTYSDNASLADVSDGQAALLEELTLLAQRLKAGSLAVNDQLKSDNTALDELSGSVEANLALVTAATDKMREETSAGLYRE